MSITLQFIGKSAEDLRFFILADGRHAGGITVHSVSGTSFSYGIAVAPAMRRQGVARAARPRLLDLMRERGFTLARVQVAPDNAASLALHRSLGFAETERDTHAVTLELTIEHNEPGALPQRPARGFAP